MIRHIGRYVFFASLLVLSGLWLFAAGAWAANNDWAEGTPDSSNGATRDYYNRAALLPWQHFMGDWRDRDDKPQGDAPFSSVNVGEGDGESVEFDVTTLVRGWLEGDAPNQGFFLRAMDGRGYADFASREHPREDQRPQLILTGERGPVKLLPQADTYLTASTYRSQGGGEGLRVSNSPNHALLRFDLADAKEIGKLDKAVLRLHPTRLSRTLTIGVFRCAQGHDEPPSQPTLGLAARYPGDAGIADDSDVIFAADFESPEWNERWTQAGKMEVLDTVAADAERQFEPLSGKALRVRIAEGSTGALNTLFKFQKETGDEPEEMYFRYYLRLGDDWNQTLQGGKLPGFSGTYGVAGWGGRKSNGENGWSARGLFKLTIPADNPLAGTTPIGTYCYHADMEGFYGTNWIWNRGYRGYLENNRWYCLEQYLKLNTPGKKDGVLRAWVDGRPALEKTDIRFRLVDRLKIEQVWMNVYHGGTKPSPYDQHVFIDNVVIARKYIGPRVLSVSN